MENDKTGRFILISLFSKIISKYKEFVRTHKFVSYRSDLPLCILFCLPPIIPAQASKYLIFIFYVNVSIIKLYLELYEIIMCLWNCNSCGMIEYL